MKTHLVAQDRTFWMGFVIVLCFAAPLSAEQFGPFTYRVVGDTIEITDYYADGVPGEVVIPADIEGKPVISIGDFAFSGGGLTSVTIPSSVTTIGDHAFEACIALTSVTIPSNVTTIGHSAFENCIGLTGLEFNPPSSLTTIDESAFEDCISLTSVTIPSSVSIVGYEAFRDCAALTSLTISHGVTTIDDGAFELCTGLTNVTIPSSVTTIGDSAFDRCAGVTSVNFTLPSSLTIIDEAAFYGCAGLTSVDLPPSVTRIGSLAFARTGLRMITIPSGVTTIDGVAFRNCTALTSVTIPSSVTHIGNAAFLECTMLTSAIFLGDAPGTFGERMFLDPAPSFSIYYLSGSTGFTSPAWNGFPATMLDVATYPAAPWLVGHGFAHDTDLDQDLNGDGVSLLLAYALNLDPRPHLQSSLPVPVVGPDTLSLSFHGASPRIEYSAQTSEDLETWVTSGVTQSDLDFNGVRTAQVDRDSPRRFLRLLVSVSAAQ